MPSFIHLRVHSAYSLSEGAIKVKEFPGLCKDNSMPAVAITDTCNMFGALEFSLSCKSAGIQPILGTILSLETIKQDQSTTLHRPPSAEPEDQILLIVQNETGYLNLLKLISYAYDRLHLTDFPQITYAELQNHNAGLIALTGGPQGPVGHYLLEDRPKVAHQNLETLRQIFDNRLYIELMRHGLPEEAKIEEELIALAYQHNIPPCCDQQLLFFEA